MTSIPTIKATDGPDDEYRTPEWFARHIFMWTGLVTLAEKLADAVEESEDEFRVDGEIPACIFKLAVISAAITERADILRGFVDCPDIEPCP